MTFLKVDLIKRSALWRSMVQSRGYVSILFLTFIWSASVLAQTERILNYDTQIEINRDRSILVTEFIEVVVNGDIIKRGITRRLPTSRELNGKNVRIKYEILEVEKNDETEPYVKEDNQDLTLYLGSRDVFLTPGVYRYKIKYRVPDQIGFFEDYDEIYWNAIGNDVQFVVENASCRVTVPPGAKIVQQAAYLGYYGQESQEFTVSNEGSVLDYRTARSLRPEEGFTIAVAMEKGVIEEAGLFDRLGTLILVILASIFLLPYYVYTWWKHGQDPPTPASYPLWEAPDGLSAASLSHINRGGYDKKSFTASVIHLAIKGYLKIEEVVEKGFFSKKRNFDLIQLKSSDKQLPKEEKQILDSLFRHDSRVSITGDYDSNVAGTYSGHEASLSAQHSAFINKGLNVQFLVIPILVTIAVVALSILWLVNSTYASPANLTAVIAFAPVAIIGLILYGYLIQKPAPEKLDLRSRIKGFQMYLELAEKDRLRLLNPPEMTPDHFETILPYAFALGVEHLWTEKFKNILEQANYQPQWNNSVTPLYFADHFGRDFSEGVSAAATKPTDSGSGSGGGGFSGGGGGGGGVGGW